MPTVRLVASDLDGTLLGPGAVLTDRTRAALAAADAAGIVVVAATGRPATTASERLAGAPTVRYLVCENGAVLYDRHEAAVIARHPMDDRAVPAVVEAVRAGVPDAGFGWEAPGGYGAEARFLTMSPPRDGVPDVVVDRLGPPYPTQVTKVLVGHARLVRDDLLAAVEPCLVDGLVATASSVRFVEIAGAGIDKAYGVARLCERLGVDRAEVAALGDHINDIALLRWAGRSVAMGDAHRGPGRGRRDHRLQRRGRRRRLAGGPPGRGARRRRPESVPRTGHAIAATVVRASRSCCFAAGRSGHGYAYRRSLGACADRARIAATVVRASRSCCFAAGRSGHGYAYRRSLSGDGGAGSHVAG